MGIFGESKTSTDIRKEEYWQHWPSTSPAVEVISNIEAGSVATSNGINLVQYRCAEGRIDGAV